MNKLKWEKIDREHFLLLNAKAEIKYSYIKIVKEDDKLFLLQSNRFSIPFKSLALAKKVAMLIIQGL